MTTPWGQKAIEAVARALAPMAWAALGTGDTLAQKNRRQASLRHASAAILAFTAALREPSEGIVRAAESRQASVHESLPADEALRAMLTRADEEIR